MILFIVSFLSFGLMYLSPGDPAESMLNAQGISVTDEVVQNLRVEMGLDKSFFEQYKSWLTNVVKGDMGTSYSTNKSVMSEIKEHMPYTLKLSASSIIFTLLISIPIGLICAFKKNTIIDNFIRGLTFVGISVPGFFISLILLYIFALKFKMLPVLSQSGFKSIILPTVSLSIPMVSKYIRQIRGCAIVELEKNYVKGLYSRGVKKHVIYINVIKNINITILTLVGLSLGSLLGGAVIIENIFVWPGLGNLALNAIKMRDYPLIQGYVIWMAVIFAVINLVIDLMYGFIDPRIRNNRRM